MAYGSPFVRDPFVVSVLIVIAIVCVYPKILLVYFLFAHFNFGITWLILYDMWVLLGCYCVTDGMTPLCGA